MLPDKVASLYITSVADASFQKQLLFYQQGFYCSLALSCGRGRNGKSGTAIINSMNYLQGVLSFEHLLPVPQNQIGTLFIH
jgi:hypothetical protein